MTTLLDLTESPLLKELKNIHISQGLAPTPWDGSGFERIEVRFKRQREYPKVIYLALLSLMASDMAVWLKELLTVFSG